MRESANLNRINEFMRAFGRAARSECRVFFTGGTTAVLMGWRDSTIGINLKFDPELDELYRAIPAIKESLEINVELASPSDFIPAIPGWQDRCRYIGREGSVSFFHYDPYGQVLSKIERGHDQDILDVEAMIASGLVERGKLTDIFAQIEPLLYKYPAIDPADFARQVSRVVESE
ncbi:MAG: DUF6036 family nucleotidyltransferase [Pyrinomonadaceae bacterium]